MISHSTIRDQEGLETLQAIANADKFNLWMFETIKPYVKGNVLEIGSGIGNISSHILPFAKQVTLSDYNQSYCELLQTKFSKHKNLAEILTIDLVDEKFDERFLHLFGLFDSVIALNVIEHIQNDDLAVKNCKKLLKLNGNFIVLVPAYSRLYNGFDKELGHFRRYTKKTFRHLICNHLHVVHSQYFNFAGIFGWFFSGTVQRKRIISSMEMKLYNKLVPIFKVADKLVFNKVGLSVVAVGKNT